MKKCGMVVVLALGLWGCTTLSQNYKLGTQAIMERNWDEAIRYLEMAVLEDPKDSPARLALLRAKITASEYYLIEARRLARQGKKEAALDMYERSLSYDPSNVRIADEARMLIGEKPAEERPLLPEIEPPIKLQVSTEKIDLKFTEAGLMSIFKALGRLAGINMMFDENFQDTPFSIDLIDMNFDRAMESLCLASKNFFSVVNENTIIIVPDQPAKRTQYETHAIRTYYLSNIKAEDVQMGLTLLLRAQFAQPIIFVDKSRNAVTVRDVPAVVDLAGKMLHRWDRPEPEIVLDLEIMEVSRQKLRSLGLDFSNHILGFRYGESTGDGDSGWLNLNGIDFSRAENFQVSLPTSILQFLETDVDTKVISQPRLRGISGREMLYVVGDKIPIPDTTFAPIAAGGVTQQPITSFKFEDVGIDVKIIPTVHFENEVTLELEIKIKALAGTGYADIPILSTREIKNTIRLKDGETNLLAGLLKDEERKTKKGIPGLRELPLLGDLFSSTDQTIQQTDVILTITPRIIRKFTVADEDDEALWFNRNAAPPGAGGRQLARPQTPMRSQIQAEKAVRQESSENQISLNPSNFEIPAGREFRINVILRTSDEIGNMSMNLNFNPEVLTLKQIVEGGSVAKLGTDVPFMKHFDSSAGAGTIGFTSPRADQGLSGRGVLATLVFDSKAEGESTVTVSGVSANSPTGSRISFQVKGARVRVR